MGLFSPGTKNVRFWGSENGRTKPLSTVKEAKVFGVWMKNNYKEMVELNWESRLDKFRRSVFSWSTRQLDTVLERVEVIKCFGLSRVFFKWLLC